MDNIQIPTLRDYRHARSLGKDDHYEEPTFSLDRYISWLNTSGAAAEEFRQLTELAQAKARLEIPRSVEPVTKRNEIRAVHSWVQAMHVIHRKTLPICRRIAAKYPSFSNLAGPLKPGGQLFFERVPLRTDLRGHDLSACYALGYLERIISADVLLRIGRCKIESCRRYFHGRVGKLYCSEKCLRQALRHTPQFRERNRKHQRDHYDKIFGKTKRWRRAREKRKLQLNHKKGPAGRAPHSKRKANVVGRFSTSRKVIEYANTHNSHR